MTLSLPGQVAQLAAITATILAAVAPSASPQAPSNGQLEGAPFERAQTAFMSHDLVAAEAAYRVVLASDTVAAHRREAALTLAAIAWRVHRDTASAERVLSEAEATEWGRFAALQERSRMLREWGDFPAARAAADAALAAATTRSESDSAATSWAAAVIAPLLAHRLAGGPGSHRTPRADSGTMGEESRATEAEGSAMGAESSRMAAEAALLREARERLDGVVRRTPGLLEPARLLVQAGALTMDPGALLTGWRSYYLVAAGDSVHGLLVAPERTLESLASPRSGSQAARESGAAPTASHVAAQQGLAAMVRALVASRFFQAAAVVALIPDSTGAALVAHDALAQAAVAYAEFLRSVSGATNEYYRKTALGAGSETSWRAALDSAARVLWAALGNADPAPRFTDERLDAELDRRFGTLINVGKSAGYMDLHMGHRVVDERRTVRQYGHTATVRFLELDAMASNGFQSWAWDGRAQHGGWGTTALIVQVRPRYADAPLEAWQEVTNPALVRCRGQRIAADSAVDLARARATPVAYFRSVADRLQRDGRLELLDSLRRTGYEGAALGTAFERAIGDMTTESAIFAHEGRHAIDDGLGVEGAPELEYRAKLSEVAFAPKPRLAFGGIMFANVGDATPHGQANLRVLKGLLGWMGSHAAEIRGLRRSDPLLPQLPLLSDAQLRLAVASLDPLARVSSR